MIKVRELHIKKFRHFSPGSVYKIGPCITLIAGINGTSKSTLLGMISQPLGFPDTGIASKKGKKEKTPSAYTRVYDSFDLYSFRTVSDRPFKASYSEIFRMSQKYDHRREHEYTLYLEGDSFDSTNPIATSGLNVRSERRADQKTNNLRFVTNSTNRKPGWGNFPHPVIYLGLERLRPLSTLTASNIISTIDLSEEEKAIWEDIYRVVMIVGGNEKVSPEPVDTGKDFKKSYLSVETTYFDAESASAGQDNLGQIITAIVSFYRLKKQLGNAYQGGVLLIDEFDATMHPIAQTLLLKKMIEHAKALSLQIIATTHSLALIEKALQDYKNDVMLLYMQRKGQKVEPQNDVNLDFVKADLACVSIKAKMKDKYKVTVLFEDYVAASFFEQVTGNVFKDFVQIRNVANKNSETALSNGVLKSIAEHLAPKKIPEFSNILYFLDPDSQPMQSNATKNLLVLPGNTCIEKMMNLFLLNKADDYSLWLELGISFQQCLHGYNNIENDPNVSSDAARGKKYKEWFAHQVESGCFGKNASKVFRIWANNHKELCFDFSNKVLDSLLKIGSPLVIGQQLQIKERIKKKFFVAATPDAN